MVKFWEKKFCSLLSFDTYNAQILEYHIAYVTFLFQKGNISLPSWHIKGDFGSPGRPGRRGERAPLLTFPIEKCQQDIFFPFFEGQKKGQKGLKIDGIGYEKEEPKKKGESQRCQEGGLLFQYFLGSWRDKGRKGLPLKNAWGAFFLPAKVTWEERDWTKVFPFELLSCFLSESEEF